MSSRVKIATTIKRSLRFNAPRRSSHGTTVTMYGGPNWICNEEPIIQVSGYVASNLQGVSNIPYQGTEWLDVSNRIGGFTPGMCVDIAITTHCVTLHYQECLQSL